MNNKKFDEQLEYQQADEALLYMLVHNNMPNNTTVMRVKKKIATKWLLENKSVVLDGTVRYLQIQDFGLGVCGVALRPKDKINTFVVSCLSL
jgi:hypothetical protein